MKDFSYVVATKIAGPDGYSIPGTVYFAGNKKAATRFCVQIRSAALPVVVWNSPSAGRDFAERQHEDSLRDRFQD